MIPDSVQSMGSSVFRACGSLLSVDLGSRITNIAESAFMDCWKLSDIEIQDSVLTIGSSAFHHTAITSVVFGASVEVIGASAFDNCHALTSLVIPKSVHEIGANAFFGCSSLREVTFQGNRPDMTDAFGYIADNATGYYHEGMQGWVPGEQIDGLTMVPMGSALDIIPRSWFTEHRIVVEDGNYADASEMVSPVGKMDSSGQPLTLWYDYVAGTNPHDKDDMFRVSRFVFVDGKWKVEFTPNLNLDDTKENDRLYTIEGATTLDGEWVSPAPLNAQFFRVKVALP